MLKQPDSKVLLDIIEYLPDPTFVKDEDHRWVNMNSRMCDFIGVRKEDLVGKSDFDFFPPGEAEVFQRKDREVFQKMEVVENEEFFTDRQGLTHVISTRKAPFQDADGRKFLIGSIRDITHIKRVEAELRDNKQRFKKTFDFAPHGMAQVSLDGKFLRCNRALSEILGYDEAELETKSFQELTHPDDLAQDLAHVKAMIRGEIQTYSMEKRYTHKTGKVVWALLSVSLVHDATGEPQYFIAQVQNISEYKSHIEELKEAKETAELGKRSRSEFLANMSHEIRTPMNSILGLSELLTTTSMNKEDQDEFLRVIHSSGQALLCLLEDIIDFSRIDANKMRVVRDRFSLRTLLQDLRTLFRLQAKERSISLEIVAETVPDIVEADPYRLRQVLLNLIGNALKFTPYGGAIEVRVATDPNNEMLRFSVHDNGIGIPEDKLSEIFEAFTQVDYSKTRVYGGAGLGLAISHRLVSLMGGRLEVSSKLGRGSRFAFNIKNYAPFAEALPADKDGSNTTGQPALPHRSLSILVAEDNSVNQLLVKTILEKAGHKVTVVDNGKEAVNIFGKAAFDVVVVDVQMPVMDGYEAARLIKAKNLEGSPREIPVIALTAHVLDDHRDECQQAGIDEVLTKPVSRKELLRKVLELATR